MAYDKICPCLKLAGVAILLSIAAVAGSAATSDGSGATRLPYRHFTFRHYRATAYINLFSVTIFSRSDVGGGYASVEDTGDNGLGKS